MGGEEPKIKDEITKKKRRGRRRPFWTSRRAESKKTEKRKKKRKSNETKVPRAFFFAFFWNWKVSRSSIFAAPFWVDDTSNWNFCLKKKKPTKKIKKKRKNRSRNLALKENPMDENGDFFFALGKGVKPPKNTVKNSVTKLISLCLLCCGKTR